LIDKLDVKQGLESAKNFGEYKHKDTKAQRLKEEKNFVTLCL